MRTAVAYLAKNRDTAWSGLFWIRLHAVITEARAEFRSITPPDDPRHESSVYVREGRRLIESIHNTFDIPEHILIEMSRHQECHIWQRGSRLAIKDGKFKDKKKLESLDEVYSIEECDRIVKELIAKIRMSPSSYAIELAKRIETDVEELYLLILKYSGHDNHSSSSMYGFLDGTVASRNCQ